MHQVNFDLKSLIETKGLPRPSDVDTSELCPSQPLQRCPSSLWAVDWDAACVTFEGPRAPWAAQWPRCSARKAWLVQALGVGDCAAHRFLSEGTAPAFCPATACTPSGPGVVNVAVGPSGSASKTIAVDARVAACPALCDRDCRTNGDWPEGGDTFSTTLTGSTLTVARTDAQAPWGLELRIPCATAGMRCRRADVDPRPPLCMDTQPRHEH